MKKTNWFSRAEKNKCQYLLAKYCAFLVKEDVKNKKKDLEFQKYLKGKVDPRD